MINSCQIVKSSSKFSPTLSVLVRVKNEIPSLPEFWSRLSRQTIFSSAEVLFLDSGSTDGTLEFLEALPVNLYQIPPEHFCFGSACNLLLSLCNAPVACFLSGHVFLEDCTALEKLLAALTGRGRAAAYLRQVPDEVFGSNCYERSYLRRKYPDSGTRVIEADDPDGFSNAASGLTREAWEEHPFPDIHGSEDLIWARKHLEMGGKLFYLSGVKAMHSHRESADQVFRRVRLNVEAKRVRGSYLKAWYYFGGVFFSMLRERSSLREALRYASCHSRAYLPTKWRSPSVPLPPLPASSLSQERDF